MSIPILIVVLEIWSTRSSPWIPSCSWQSSPWRPPPTRPLASCYRCHYTQWSPQKDGIKIRALVVELLHLKERGQKCDRHTDRHTDIGVYRKGTATQRALQKRNQDLSSRCGVIALEREGTKVWQTDIHTHLLLRPLPYGCGLKNGMKIEDLISEIWSTPSPLVRSESGNYSLFFYRQFS